MNNLGRDATPLSEKIRNTLFFVFLSTRGKLERKHSFLDPRPPIPLWDARLVSIDPARTALMSVQ